MDDDQIAETLHLPSFEEQVLARLDTIGVRLSALEKREAERPYDTKPIWDRLLKEFSDMRDNVNVRFDDFDRMLEVINKELLHLKSDMMGIERRLGKVETQLQPQMVIQAEDF